MILALPFPDIGPDLISIQVFGLTLALRYYALAYIVGILIGWWLILRAVKAPQLWPEGRAPLTQGQVEDFLTWSILGIILGGRLGFVLFYQPVYYLQNPVEILYVWQGGMAFHGGLLGIVVAGLLYCRKHALPIAQMGDALALAAPAGLLLGRIANFINAELWGRPTDMPWGVVFPGAAAQDCPGVIGACARHPSQLYEAGLEGLVLGLLLIWLVWARGWLKRPGQIMGMFFAGYGASRAFVEEFRQADAQFITPDNPMGHVILGLSMGQLLSLPMVALGAGLIIWARRR